MFGRCRIEGLPELLEFLGREEPFVLGLHFVPAHVSARVGVGRAQFPHFGQVEHLDQHLDCSVCHRRLLAQLVLKRQDVLAFHLRHLEFPQGGHDVLGEHDAVVGHGRRLAMHRDVFALVALGKLHHRGLGLGGGGRNWRLSGLDAGDDASGFLAGLVGRDVAVSSHGHALGPSGATGLDDVDLGARGIDTETEPGKLPIPEDGVLVIDRETVDDPFRERAILACGHRLVQYRFG